MHTLQLVLVLVVLVPFAIGYLLPEVGAYFLGPAILVIAAVLAVVFHKLFVPFQSDGSPAGLIVPGLAWFALVTACIAGILLIVTGKIRMRPAGGRPAPPATEADLSVSSATATLHLFNVALGASILIAPFVSIYSMFSAIDSVLYRTLGVFGSRVILFLLAHAVTALVLYACLRVIYTARKVSFTRGVTRLILIGNAVALFLDFAYIGQMAGNTTISRAFMTIALFRELLSWLAWAAILIGLFLFWKAQSTRSAASEA
jgi:hypothetical protein